MVALLLLLGLLGRIIDLGTSRLLQIIAAACAIVVVAGILLLVLFDR